MTLNVHHQLYEQDIKGCLDTQIGDRGLSQSALDQQLASLQSTLRTLQSGYADQTMRHLCIPGERADLDHMTPFVERLSEGAKTFVVLGTGGSSMGGQALIHWQTRSSKKIAFFDNLDAVLFARQVAELDLDTTRFVIISKSGNTSETLAQTIHVLSWVQNNRPDTPLGSVVLGITEPSADKNANGLRKLLEHHDIPVIEHDPKIGGRYSVLTNVGMLPALLGGLEPLEIRRGAQAVVDELLEAEATADCAPAIGAAAAIGLLKTRGITNFVLMPYVAQLRAFACWHRQLWAESLGKDGRGSIPVAALGPVDQHSQLQLFLDGPPHFMMNLITTNTKTTGPMLDPKLSALAGAEYLQNHTIGDLIDAQQRMAIQVFRDSNRPTRVMHVAKLDDAAMGALFMHFMLETIFAAALLDIDPYNQPAVERGKNLTQEDLRPLKPI